MPLPSHWKKAVTGGTFITNKAIAVCNSRPLITSRLLMALRLLLAK